MDYKKKYIEASKWVKSIFDELTHEQQMQAEAFFPELKESEDERIRKGLVKAFGTIGKKDWGGLIVRDILAWLEKQGEQKPILDFKASDWYVSKVDRKIHNMYHSVDKVEPKFKVGDWVIDNIGDIYQIEKATEIESEHIFGYTVVGGGYFNDNNNGVRLWTIQDAKDGDILSFETEDCEWILIFKDIIPASSVVPHDSLRYHALLSGDALSDNDICAMVSDDYEYYIHPATKEQWDMLFNKMREVGTKWDSEKKQLEYVKL